MPGSQEMGGFMDGFWAMHGELGEGWGRVLVNRLCEMVFRVDWGLDGQRVGFSG